MVRTARTFPYASYEEQAAAGSFSTPANCVEFLLQKKILPTSRLCCDLEMILSSAPLSRYRDQGCWKCSSCHRTSSIRKNSVLENSNITPFEFITILQQFSESKSVRHAASHANVSENTARWCSAVSDSIPYLGIGRARPEPRVCPQ